jgi:hypothetical protein
VALTVGVAGDALFQGQSLGLNVFVWLACFVAALAGLLRVGGAPLRQGRRYLIAPALVLGALFAWHDSSLLVAANLLALAGVVAAAGLRRVTRRRRLPGVLDYVGGFVASAAATMAGPVPMLKRDVRWDEVRRTTGDARLASVGRGLALSAPLLLLFGGLFVAADAVFKGLVTDAVPSFPNLFGRIGISLGAGWLSAGLLRDLCTAREEKRVVSAAAVVAKAPRVSLGTTEIAIVLALLDLLFLVFVLVQFRYLFGGKGIVEARTDLTYAHYARHGFFELVAVSVLALPLLLVCDWARRREGPARERLFRVEAGVLVALLLVVMASALQRMRLYEHEYGLTELRLYATSVIIWLAVVFLWLAATVLRGRRGAFAPGALLAGLIATLVLNVANPDALIARTNLSRPHLDVRYLANLSDDAVPTLVDRLGQLPRPQRRQLALELLKRSEPNSGWPSWNLSRRRAARTLEEHRVELVRFAVSPG